VSLVDARKVLVGLGELRSMARVDNGEARAPDGLRLLKIQLRVVARGLLELVDALVRSLGEYSHFLLLFSVLISNERPLRCFHRSRLHHDEEGVLLCDRCWLSSEERGLLVGRR